MKTLLQDLRYGMRSLFKKPGLTIAAVSALALGIGANTAIFSLIHSLLLNPIPFPEIERVAAVWENNLSRGVQRNESSMANYLDWRAQNQSFENLGLYRWWSVNVTGIDPPERVQGFLVTANMFDVTGVKPALGRGFAPDEEQSGKDKVAVLSHGFWQRRFGGDPNIIGKTIMFNGIARAVIGVMPPEYNYPPGAEVLAPFPFTQEVSGNRRSHSYLAVGRLKRGVSMSQAQTDLATIARRLEQQYPETNTGWNVVVYPLLDDAVRHYKPSLAVLMGAVGFVLLIACANVANLMLARAAGRFKEIAIRSALGASRLRIIQQLMAESVILAVIGGLLGIVLAYWGLELLKVSVPSEALLFVLGFSRISINPSVLGFTFCLSILTGILFGLAPAAQASKPDLNEALKEGIGRTSSGGGRNRLRSLLVISEVTLSFVLLVGAGLMIKSFWQILRADPGFNSEDAITMSITLPAAKYREDPQRKVFYEDLVRRVKELPGVEAAGAVNYLPLGGSNSSSSILIEGLPEPPPGQEYEGRYRVCTPDYFRTMQIRVLKGREFSDLDTADSPKVVIINETMARRYWENGDAVGKRIRFTGPLQENPWMEVVAVVNDVKHELNIPVTPEYYLPHSQDPWSSMIIVARSKTDLAALAASIKREAAAVDKDQPVSDVLTMEQVRSRSVILYSFSSVLLTIFAAIALLLAVVGIYGVLSYNVAQRTRELGIRMALGAESSDVLKLVIRQGMTMTAIGLGIGLICAAALSKAISGLLFQVPPTDWITFASVALILAAAAFAACCIPARRATRIDPMNALRYE